MRVSSEEQALWQRRDDRIHQGVPDAPAMLFRLIEVEREGDDAPLRVHAHGTDHRRGCPEIQTDIGARERDVLRTRAQRGEGMRAVFN